MTHPYIEHLKKDHDKQRRLGEELRKATDPEKRKELRQKMHEELIPHMEGEEASIFAYMEEVGGEAREEALKALEEHHVDRVLDEELMNLPLDAENFSAKAYVLDEVNTHHIDEEEKVHFPMLEGMASKEKLDELFERYEEAEKKAKGK